MATHAQLKDAIEYINYCIKEGFLEQEDVDTLSDDELVQLANRMRDTAE